MTIQNHSEFLSSELAQIFNECQKTTLNHRRNCIALKKLQTHFPTLPANSSQRHSFSFDDDHEDYSSARQEWENQFFVEFLKMTAVVLAANKNDEVVLRLIKFINSYCLFTSNSESNSQSMEEQEIHTRFMDNFIKCLLHGVESKEKNVRHRVCLLLDGSIGAVDEMRNDLLEFFVIKVAGRLFDKEAIVRVAAVQALSRLQVRLFI